ncbi:MAG TPA: AmmeMemoRadiSam system protein B, partial [Usitatibacteraceae bacterium]|nr:AmmeMemoRadiSam system protein B [Usitatibacteraceae bacterium]
RGLALPGAEALATPLGAVPVDNEAVSLLSDLPQVSTRADVHRAEHSLEVQLPFLQAVLGDFCVVPLAVGDASDREVAEVLERLWGGPETLVVISSDLSHFLDDRAAKAIDGHTARAIVHLDALQSHEQACGATPINGLLLAARRRGLRGEQVDLRTSGDTAGDRRRVVGYGAFAFFEQACGDASHPPPIRDT